MCTRSMDVDLEIRNVAVGISVVGSGNGICDDVQITSNHLDNIQFSASGPPRLILAKDGSQFDRALINTDKKNFAPRMGIAWQLGQHMVIRSGFGIYYGNDIGNISYGTNMAPIRRSAIPLR